MIPFLLESNDSHHQLILSGAVTIEHARDLHTALSAALSDKATLRIDASAVSLLDAGILQVLLAAARTAQRTELVAESPAWSQALQRFGVAPAAFPLPDTLAQRLP